MRRTSSGTRTFTAVVVALLMLSIVLGDTREAGAAPVVPPASSVRLFAVECAGASATQAGWRAGQAANGPTVIRRRVESNPGATVRSVAGIPPWVIWPPSPVPRIAGALLRRPTLNAPATIQPSAPHAGWHPMLTLPPAPIAENPRLDLKVPAPPARLAGADHSVPRPPPLAVASC